MEKNIQNKNSTPQRKRFFSDVPRPLLTVAVVAGGCLGLLLNERFHWYEFESFIYTLIIVVGFVFLVVSIYRRLRGTKPG
jgi:hypothetical protein